MKKTPIFVGIGLLAVGVTYLIFRDQIKTKFKIVMGDLQGKKIQFEEKLSPAFVKKVKEIAVSLGVDPSWLTSVMDWETIHTFSPSIQNKKTKATGLIQFMPDTAISLGTTTEKLKKMTAVDQLDYVLKYFKSYQNLPKDNFTRFYLVVFYPVAVNKPYSFIFPNSVYLANPVFRKPNRNYINKQDVEDALKKMYPLAYQK